MDLNRLYASGQKLHERFYTPCGVTRNPTPQDLKHKTGAGTPLNQHSKVWFSLGHGIVKEVYFPRSTKPAPAIWASSSPTAGLLFRGEAALHV
jgi:Glucodextranase, domain N